MGQPIDNEMNVSDSVDTSIEQRFKELSIELAESGSRDQAPLACRWRMHTFVTLTPTDDEHKELCDLLGRPKVSVNMDTLHEVIDRVCIRCGHIDPGLQRFLIALRKLRKFGK